MELNVLLVDDSATTRAVIRKTLKLAGLQPTAIYEAISREVSVFNNTLN